MRRPPLPNGPRLFRACFRLELARVRRLCFSQARTAIWKDRAGFDQAAANYAAVSARLAALAQANDTAGFTKHLEEVNQACSSCHGFGLLPAMPTAGSLSA
jgi:hypothetical protein